MLTFVRFKSLIMTPPSIHTTQHLQLIDNSSPFHSWQNLREMEVPELSSGQGTQNPIHGNNPKSSFFFARGNRNFTLTTL